MKRQDLICIKPDETIVAVDMDGVLFDYVGEFMRRWEKTFPEIFLAHRDTHTHHELEKQFPEYVKEVRQVASQEDFFDTLPLIEGAKEGLEALDSHYNGKVYICTAPSIWNLGCVPGKYKQIHKHFGHDWMRKTHFVKDKTTALATYLIDDKPKITGMMEPRWEHIRYAQPYNLGKEPRIEWEDIIAAGGDLSEAKKLFNQRQPLEKIIYASWEESERGWGVRPDGCSLHLNEKDYHSYIRDYWAGLPSSVPDEYSRPSGSVRNVHVVPDLYKQIQETKNGLRLWQAYKHDLINRRKIVVDTI